MFAVSLYRELLESLTVPSIDDLLQVISYSICYSCSRNMFYEDAHRILSMLSVASIAVATVLARSRSILHCHIQTIT